MTDPIKVPGCDWRPCTGKSTNPLTYDIFCAHTMVWTNEAAIAYGCQPGNPYAHLYLAANGYCAQIKDLRYTSAANLDGNWHVIAMETEDKGPAFPSWSGSDVPAWTNAQLDKIVAVAAWCCKRFNIPPKLIPDTKPGRRGLAYHRQGINPWRVDGGELWSNATGKVCPGDRRVSQFVNIVVPRVAAIVNQEDDLTPEEHQELFYIGDRLQRVEDGLKDASTGYVSDAFTESGTGTRTAIAGSADGTTTGLFDIGWDRSKKRRYMESKIDKLLEHFGIEPPAPPT